jgi:hypothetical protein
VGFWVRRKIGVAGAVCNLSKILFYQMIIAILAVPPGRR